MAQNQHVEANRHAIEEKQRAVGIKVRILLLGESGLGKSTFISSLLENADRELLVMGSDGTYAPAQSLPGGESTQDIRFYRYIFHEADNTPVIYDIIDSPGFAAFIDNSNCWKSKLWEIERRLEEYDKMHKSDPREDPRILCAIYCLPPNNRPLKPLDITVLSELQQFLPIIPIIMKADAMTSADLSAYKALLRTEFLKYSLTLWRCFEDDAAPYACISSSERYVAVDGGAWVRTEDPGKGVYGRMYNWGLAQCNEHSDLREIRKALIVSEPLRERMNELYLCWRDRKQAMLEEVRKELKERQEEFITECCGWRRIRPSRIDNESVEKAWVVLMRQKGKFTAQDMLREMSIVTTDSCDRVPLPTGAVHVEGEHISVVLPAGAPKVAVGAFVTLAGVELYSLVALNDSFPVLQVQATNPADPSAGQKLILWAQGQNYPKATSTSEAELSIQKMTVCSVPVSPGALTISGSQATVHLPKPVLKLNPGDKVLFSGQLFGELAIPLKELCTVEHVTDGADVWVLTLKLTASDVTEAVNVTEGRLHYSLKSPEVFTMFKSWTEGCCDSYAQVFAKLVPNLDEETNKRIKKRLMKTISKVLLHQFIDKYPVLIWFRYLM